MTSFVAKVLHIVSQIPKGQTLTYKEVAAKAGNSKAARAVGAIMRSYDSSVIQVPCHRVVRSDGKLGGYRWGADKKKHLLEKEGVRIG